MKTYETVKRWYCGNPECCEVHLSSEEAEACSPVYDGGEVYRCRVCGKISIYEDVASLCCCIEEIDNRIGADIACINELNGRDVPFFATPTVRKQVRFLEERLQANKERTEAIKEWHKQQEGVDA